MLLHRLWRKLGSNLCLVPLLRVLATIGLALITTARGISTTG
jgi:hypothetical protein